MPLWRQKEAAWQESLPPPERGRPRCPVNAMARVRRSTARTVPPFAGKRACRRFAQTRRACGRRARRGRRPCRRARARRTARSPCRRAWADGPPRARRTHAPRAHPARRQGFSGYREVPTVCSKARSIPNMRSPPPPMTAGIWYTAYITRSMHGCLSWQQYGSSRVEVDPSDSDARLWTRFLHDVEPQSGDRICT